MEIEPHKLKSRAAAAVSYAVKKGTLPRLDGSIPCVDCGAPAKNYDHRDYRKPLKVVPVCVRCNYYRGSAKPYADYRSPDEIKFQNTRILSHIRKGTSIKAVAKMFSVKKDYIENLIISRQRIFQIKEKYGEN